MELHRYRWDEGSGVHARGSRELGDSPSDVHLNNMQRKLLDGWCIRYSSVKEAAFHLRIEQSEIRKLVLQLERMGFNCFIDNRGHFVCKPPVRICGHAGCTTVLSRYNRGRYCALHS